MPKVDTVPADTVPALIAERVAASPDAVALVSEFESLTYQELDRRADAVAARLAEADVPPGAVVGVLLERTPTMVAVWLGVLKAGAAYLPLDPSYPAARLRFMLEDAKVSLVVTDTATAAVLPDPGVRTMLVEGALPTAPPPQVAIDPADVAYVIYTSGSTGTPKGAMVEHRNISNTIKWYADTIEIEPGDRVGQTAAAGFDVASWEIWGNLLAGAEVHLAPEAIRRAPQRLCQWVVQRQLHHVCLITPVAVLALQHGWLDGSSLRVLMTGGEKLHVTPPADAPYKCYNLYGPTETAVIATYAPVPAGSTQAPPIGWPIGGATAQVLDAQGVAVPDGVEGELYIGGAGVGRGYLHQPELTAQRFVPDPTDPGGRLYRTGDLVRRRDDGQLDFVGRVDDQVKVRGYRIELGEIETQLQAHPEVAAAAVTVWEPRLGYPRLVGYVSGGACGSRADGAQVRRWLSERLPAHMVPAVVMVLDRLPLTANQKVDRAALPDPGLLPEPEFADPAHARLAADWREACGVMPETPADTLVALGAGSLDMIALQARVAARCGRPIPPDALNLMQTLDEQAEVIGRVAAAPAPAAGGAPGGLGSLGQESIVFLEEIAGSGMGYQYQGVLEGPGEPDDELLERALLAVIRSQAALSASWRLTGEGLVGEPAAPDNVALDRHRVATSDVDALVAKLVAQPIRYDEQPLIRFDLIRHDSGTVLLHREHHLVHDGWSVGVLLEQVQAAYDGLARDGHWSPRPHAVTYFDWAAAQRERATGPGGAQAREFWREHLADAPTGRPALPWATRPERAGQSAQVSIQRLDGERCARLEKVASRLGVTPFSLLLSAFRQLQWEYQGPERGVIGSGFANRDAGSRHLIGMFVNVLPLSRDYRAGQSAARAAREEMALITQAARHQWLPTSEIVRLAYRGDAAPTLTHNPLYQVMFSMHDAPIPQLRFGDWSPALREMGNGHGKTDLSVIVMNRVLQHGRTTGRRDTGSWALRWEHDPALYPAESISVLQQRFLQLLDHGCAHPETPWPTRPGTDWNGEKP